MGARFCRAKVAWNRHQWVGKLCSTTVNVEKDCFFNLLIDDVREGDAFVVNVTQTCGNLTCEGACGASVKS